MEIVKEKKIEDLVKNGVVIAAQEYLARDGELQALGETERVSYGNWERDRQRLIENEPADIIASVLGMWGDVPALDNPVLTNPESLPDDDEKK